MSSSSTFISFFVDFVKKALLSPIAQLWKTSSPLKRYGLLLPSGITLFNYFVCKYRLYPHNIFYRIWFSASLTGCLLGSFTTVALPAHILGKLGIIKKRNAEKIAAAAVNIATKVLTFLNPQLRIHLDYDREGGSNWDDVPKHSLISANHNSYLDPFVYTSLVPTIKNYIHQKGFMKGSLRNIPIAGYLFFEVLSQFPVHYNSEELENFSVDKDKQAKELERVLSWIGPEENSFVYSPEGRVNPAPDTIQNLRYGMLKIIYERVPPHVPWFHITLWPAQQFWGRTDFTGGVPCDLYVTMKQYHVPRDDVTISKDGGKTCDDVEKFAAHLKAFMQEELDLAREKHRWILLKQQTYRTASDWWKIF